MLHETLPSASNTHSSETESETKMPKCVFGRIHLPKSKDSIALETGVVKLPKQQVFLNTFKYLHSL